MNLYSPRRSGLSTKLLLGCLALTLPMVASAEPKPEQSRSFEGVTATFEIQNPVLRQREDLKVVVVYENRGDRTIKFRFFPVDNDVRIYRKGENKRIAGFPGELPISEVTLRPGERISLEDIVHLKEWPDLPPGDYEIRFFYHLGGWLDEAIVQKYQAKYPHEEYVVPWNDRAYGFALVANPEPSPAAQEIDLSDIPVATVIEISPQESPQPGSP